ncbi:hypothetical protein CgunFtcFv8_011151 [Champsocephalus gunnari]|uniref:Uncharacterized protein n=1 Tax=Champsocephalus gunnari TaxID=52237 RepID=A0AAN8HVT1_CHAGU|nr:hypothetical protein CgunFtcFv8_011151 [Champsocephalus gunnari]
MTAVNCASVKRLLLLTSSPPITDYKDKSIPTLIISTSHLIFLREAFAHFCAITGTVSVNTPQEFDPRFPRLPGPAERRLGRGTCPQAVLFPANTHLPTSLTEEDCRFRSGPHPRPVCTTSLSLLMIGRLDV